MTWSEAKTYCSKIGARLPTISELRSLVRVCVSTGTGGACGVTDNCLKDDCYDSNDCSACTVDTSGKYSYFGDNFELWSSSGVSTVEGDVWTIDFGSASLNYRWDALKFKARCVSSK